MNFLLLNFVISLFVVSLTTFLTAVFILYKSWGNKTNTLFAIYSLLFTWWTFFQAFGQIVERSDASIYYSKAIILGFCLIPALFIHFIDSLLNKNRKWLIGISYFLSTIFIFLNIFTPYMTMGVQTRFFIRNFIVPGPAYKFAVIFMLCSVAYGLAELFIASKKADEYVRKNQLKYLFLASTIGYASGFTLFFPVFGLHVPVINPFAFYLVGVYVAMVAYTILKYHLMDIDVVIKKALIYSVLIAIVSGIITAISFLSEWFVQKIPGFRFWTVPLLAGLASVLVGRVFWNKSKEVDKLKYEFITVAAHKLRTPLTRIKWSIDILKSRSVDEKEKETLLSGMASANDRLVELTNELLDVSNIQTNKFKYTLKKEDLVEIAEEVVKDVEHQIKEKNIKLDFSSEASLPKIMLDKMRISSVIQVMIENAITYTKDEIKINVKKDGKYLMFSVKDNGIGVLQEDKERIFSKFYRSHKAYLIDTEGSGIGLFLAKSIIEKHDGKLGVDSDGEDKGSTFWFKLRIF